MNFRLFSRCYASQRGALSIRLQASRNTKHSSQTGFDSCSHVGHSHKYQCTIEPRFFHNSSLLEDKSRIKSAGFGQDSSTIIKEIELVHKDIEKVERDLKSITEELESLGGILIPGVFERGMTFFETSKGKPFARYKQHYTKDDCLVYLRDKEKQLRDEKKQLRDKEKQLRDKEKQLRDEKKQLRDEKKQLRDEKKQLRDKEKQLRDEKKQVRDMENILLEKAQVNFNTPPPLDGSAEWCSHISKYGYKDASRDVRHFFVEGVAGEEILESGKGWKRDRNLDDFADQMALLYKKTMDLSEFLDDGKNNVVNDESDYSVQHLGDSVIKQTIPKNLLESDAGNNPSVLMRKSMRDLTVKVLDDLREPNFNMGVFVVGQPGIGKTRSGLMFLLQGLLHEKQPVMRIGYKGDQAHVFIPREDGSYMVWRGEMGVSLSSELRLDERMVVLIDPPEEAGYRWRCNARTVKYCSNDHDQHFKNVNKDRYSFYYAPMPTEKEMIIMARELRAKTEKTDPDFDELKVLRRSRLVGCAMRYVIDDKKFNERIDEIIKAVEIETRPYSYSQLIKIQGEYTRLSGSANLATVSSKVYLLDSKDFLFPEIIINNLFWALLTKKLRTETKLNLEILPDEFERMFESCMNVGWKFKQFDVKDATWTEVTFEPRESLRLAEGNSWESVTNQIKFVDETDLLSTRSSENFPVADFIFMSNNRLSFVNCKSGRKKTKFSMETMKKMMDKAGVTKMDFYVVVRSDDLVSENPFGKDSEEITEFMEDHVNVKYLVLFREEKPLLGEEMLKKYDIPSDDNLRSQIKFASDRELYILSLLESDLL